MFASPTSPHVKIIDFGLSKKYAKNEVLSQTVGTVRYKESMRGGDDDIQKASPSSVGRDLL